MIHRLLPVVLAVRLTQVSLTFVLLILVSLTLAVAADAAAQQTPCPTPHSTYDFIQRGIFEKHGCTQSFCHGASREDGLDLRADVSYDNLLHHAEEPADGDEPDEEHLLVAPRRPGDSLLWLKLAAKTLRLRGVPGAPMPLNALPISTDELEGLRLWILAGAPETGFVDAVSDLIDACPQPQEGEEDVNLPECLPDDRYLLLPDLTADPPADIRVRAGAGGHRRLEFTTAVANRGDGPLIVRAAARPTQPGQTLEAIQVVLREDGTKCARPAGTISFSTDGSRWAYGNMADYEVRKDDPYTGQVVARTSKTAYCLLDTDPIRAAEDRPHQFEAHCTDSIGRMGISVGYKDVYHRVQPGQWIDLDRDPETRIEPGTYYLVNVTNPNSLLWEIDDSREANLSYKRVSVALPVPDLPTVTPTPSPTPDRTPLAQHTVRPPRAPHPQRTPRPPGVERPGRPLHPARPTRAASRPRQPRHPMHPDSPHRPGR